MNSFLVHFMSTLPVSTRTLLLVSPRLNPATCQPKVVVGLQRMMVKEGAVPLTKLSVPGNDLLRHEDISVGETNSVQGMTSLVFTCYEYVHLPNFSVRSFTRFASDLLEAISSILSCSKRRGTYVQTMALLSVLLCSL